MATYNINTDTIPSLLNAGDIINGPYCGSGKSATLPAGTYLLECWGAQGGSYDSYLGGFGGYSKGFIKLTEPTLIYVYTGGQPTSRMTTSATNAGGFNGGGSARYHVYNSIYSYCCAGGGASDIRIATDSLYARVLVAGGGAGSVNSDASLVRYGGGEVAGSGRNPYYAATQTTGGTKPTSDVELYYYDFSAGTFGQGASANISTSNYSIATSGAGGGWYGGASNTQYYDSTTSSGDQYGLYLDSGGGSGFTLNSTTIANVPSGYLLDSTYYLTNTQNIGGNQYFNSPDGEYKIGNSGNGYVRITFIGDTSTYLLNTNVAYGRYSGNYCGPSGTAINGSLIPLDNYTFNTNYGASVSITDSSGDITSSAYNPSDATISFVITSDTSIVATAVTNTVTYTLTRCTSSNTSINTTPRGSYSTTLTPNGGGSFEASGGSVQVLMGGTDITSSVYDSSTHTITITSVTGDIQIIATAVSSYISISATNCTCSQSTGYYEMGSAFSATVTYNSGYNIISTINPVTITMGGVDISSTAYDYTNHTISISSLTGDVVIVLIANTTSIEYRTGIGAPSFTSAHNYDSTGIAVNFKPLTWTQTLGTQFTVRLSTYHGYVIDYTNTSVVMDGVDITSSVVSQLTDTITIPTSGVSIIITAKATAAASSYTLNLASLSDYHFSDNNTYSIRTKNGDDLSEFKDLTDLQGISIPTASVTSFDYDGEYHEIAIDNYDTKSTQAGTTKALNAGSYSVTFTRPTYSYWMSDTPSTRIASTQTINWTINKANNVISSSYSLLNFTDDMPIITIDFNFNYCEVYSIISSAGAGCIESYLSGQHLVLKALKPSNGTLTIKVLSSTNYNESNSIIINYTSTVTQEYNYGDGSLNTVSYGYEGKLMVQGHQQWYNNISVAQEDTNISNFRASLLHQNQSQTYPARTGYEDTDLYECIFSSPITAVKTITHWIPDCYGKSTYPFTAYWGKEGSIYDPDYSYTYGQSIGSEGYVPFDSIIPGNNTIHLVVGFGVGGAITNFKLNVDGNYLSFKELVDSGYIKPIVIINPYGCETNVPANILNLYSNIEPHPISSYTKIVQFVFTLNPHHNLSGFYISSSATYGTIYHSVGYTDISNARLTLREN